MPLRSECWDLGATEGEYIIILYPAITQRIPRIYSLPCPSVLVSLTLFPIPAGVSDSEMFRQ